MRFFWLVLLAVGTFCSAVAHANTRVGNAVIDLPIAAGYCRFVPQNALDQLVLQSIEQQIRDTGNRLLAIDVECAELQAWRSGQTKFITRYMQYQASPSLEGKLSHTPSTVLAKAVCDHVRTETSDAAAPMAERLRRVLRQENVQQDSIQILGILSEGADGCFYAMTNRMSDGPASVVVLGISAALIVKGEAINYNVYGPAQNAEISVEFARHRQNVRELVKANGGP